VLTRYVNVLGSSDTHIGIPKIFHSINLNACELRDMIGGSRREEEEKTTNTYAGQPNEGHEMVSQLTGMKAWMRITNTLLRGILRLKIEDGGRDAYCLDAEKTRGRENCP
jgi:hypothetical protein